MFEIVLYIYNIHKLFFLTVPAHLYWKGLQPKKGVCLFDCKLVSFMIIKIHTHVVVQYLCTSILKPHKGTCQISSAIFSQICKILLSTVAPEGVVKKPPSCGPSYVGRGSTGGHTWSSGKSLNLWIYIMICCSDDLEKAMTIGSTWA